MQLKSESNLGTTEEHYLKVVGAKTAALFAAAAESGATLCERGAEFVEALRDYGDNLGIAFQLVDDALDYSGRQAMMGKAVGDDFREAKVTLPVILAYARADATGGHILEARHRGRPAERSRSRTRHHLCRRDRRDPGNHDRARGTMPTRPWPRSNRCAHSETRAALADIADFCVERAY